MTADPRMAEDAETGSWFPVPGDGQLPSELRSLFAKARERIGFVPNVFRVYAFRPQRLSAWFAHYRQLHQPTEMYNFTNRMAMATNMLPNEQYSGQARPGLR